MLTKNVIQHLPRSLSPRQSAWITLWSLIMITLPIVDWRYGWEVMVAAIIAGVLVQAVTVSIILWDAWGLSRTLWVAALIAIMGWAAEAIGSHTSYPFGGYSYTDALQPQLYKVPLLIPLAWLMMLPPSWAAAEAISRSFPARWRGFWFIGLSALAMTVWDLFLDPQMVSWGLWEWHNPGGFFGIPWSNYLGWLLLSAAITCVIRPRELPVAPLLLVYTITWLLQTVGLGIFWDMPGPAIVGGVLMGGLVILAWRAHSKNMK